MNPSLRIGGQSQNQYRCLLFSVLVKLRGKNFEVVGRLPPVTRTISFARLAMSCINNEMKLKSDILFYLKGLD